MSPQLTREHAETQVPCAHFWSKLQSKSDSHCGLAFTKNGNGVEHAFDKKSNI